MIVNFAKKLRGVFPDSFESTTYRLFFQFAKSRRNDEFKKSDDESDEPSLKKSDIIIPRDKIETQFCRSSGAGGQNVNKLNTKAELRFNVGAAEWMSKDVKKKFIE
jgi:peptidyl-tRNA hydrolase ICT1